jgi:hypothetical protein
LKFEDDIEVAREHIHEMVEKSFRGA